MHRDTPNHTTSQHAGMTPAHSGGGVPSAGRWRERARGDAWVHAAPNEPTEQMNMNGMNGTKENDKTNNRKRNEISK